MGSGECPFDRTTPPPIDIGSGKAALEKLTDMQFTVDEGGTRHGFGKTSKLAEK